MHIRDLIQQNTKKFLGGKASSREALLIHTVTVGLEAAQDFRDLLERGVVALEAIARNGGGVLAAPVDPIKAARKAEAARKAAELEAEAAKIKAEAEAEARDDD